MDTLMHYLSEWPAWASEIICHSDEYYAEVDAVIDHILAGATAGEVEEWRANPDDSVVLGWLTYPVSLQSKWGDAGELARDLVDAVAVDESVDLDDVAERLAVALAPACAAMSTETIWYEPGHIEATITHRELLDMIDEEDGRAA